MTAEPPACPMPDIVGSSAGVRGRHILERHARRRPQRLRYHRRAEVQQEVHQQLHGAARSRVRADPGQAVGGHSQ